MKNDQDMLDRLFRQGRSYPGWEGKSVPEALLRALYDLTKMGPTSMNCCPGRWVFVASAEGKDKLLPCLSEGNFPKTKAAPVTAICAYDKAFFDAMPLLWPHGGDKIKDSLARGGEKAQAMARFNASLQAGYFLLAARACGLDCGPMAGFDRAKVDDIFFPDGRWTTLMLCNLGFGRKDSLRPRGPRLPFGDACAIR